MYFPFSCSDDDFLFVCLLFFRWFSSFVALVRAERKKQVEEQKEMRQARRTENLKSRKVRHLTPTTKRKKVGLFVCLFVLLFFFFD